MTLKTTQATIASTIEIQALNEHGERVSVQISGEHPLTLYLDKKELLTLMTLGAQPEALALGWLINQRFIKNISEIDSIQVDWETESVAITTSRFKQTGQSYWDMPEHTGLLDKKTTTTGCGQGTVFGDMMEDLNSIQLSTEHPLNESVLYTIMDRVRKHESVYKMAGAVHGCALCSNSGENRGEILLFVEDVGRHNAVDAIAGLMWMNNISAHDKVFYTTGRLTSEMVIKCAQMGIPVLVSRSGLTQMGYDIANKLGITMLGRCQGKHYLLYTGESRFVREPQTGLYA